MNSIDVMPAHTAVIRHFNGSGVSLFTPQCDGLLSANMTMKFIWKGNAEAVKASIITYLKLFYLADNIEFFYRKSWPSNTAAVRFFSHSENEALHELRETCLENIRK